MKDVCGVINEIIHLFINWGSFCLFPVYLQTGSVTSSKVHAQILKWPFPRGRHQRKHIVGVNTVVFQLSSAGRQESASPALFDLYGTHSRSLSWLRLLAADATGQVLNSQAERRRCGI